MNIDPAQNQNNRSSIRLSARKAFTLIEVLVVVAIIALLIAILLPSLSRARAQAKTVICMSQLQQLMKAALLYKTDFKERLPGAAINDVNFATAYDNYMLGTGTRNDWLTWVGTWAVVVPYSLRNTTQFWAKVPRNGRLWKYYRNDELLHCPASLNYNGKFSYSTPENVTMAMKDPTSNRGGLPPVMDKVKHTAQAIMYLEEDEEHGLTTYSIDDGFGGPDMFANRHLGKAAVVFFDGHAEAHFFPRGKKENGIMTAEIFEAKLFQIAPFNCYETPLPWNWRGVATMPKYKCSSNYPPGGGPGCN